MYIDVDENITELQDEHSLEIDGPHEKLVVNFGPCTYVCLHILQVY